ncbi:MAG: radical SAM family heme chaperone HemW [Bacteroidota bacterium]
MAGIYIHIPFCRKACHYCNFHFSTSLHRKPALLEAIKQEIYTTVFPAGVVPERNIETVYFGGGTPSLLETEELVAILDAMKQNYQVNENAEITLESNPDDITEEKLSGWKNAGINRLSIGIQSFFEDDLKWMNRAHNAAQAKACIALSRQYGFNDLTIDLIYGTPTLTDQQWQDNVATALSLGINHLSCYALTVEANTALNHFIQKGKLPPVDEEKQGKHFELLVQWMEEAGFEQYEISNFSRPGHQSRHNSNYWSGKAYYGFGPAAHSFDGNKTRWWNIANNAIYSEKIMAGKTVFESEILTPVQRLNEIIMTSLRTMQGLDLTVIDKQIGQLSNTGMSRVNFYQQLEKNAAENLLTFEDDRAILTKKGKFFADGIASGLFL